MANAQVHAYVPNGPVLCQAKDPLDHEKATFGPNFETIDVILRGVAHLQTFREFLPRTQTFGATRRDKEPSDLLIGNQIPTAQSPANQVLSGPCYHRATGLVRGSLDHTADR